MSSPLPSVRAGAGAPGHRNTAWLGWLRGYERATLAADVLAGLTAAAVVLPKAMAYATVAGLPVQAGLYAAFLPPIVYAALGRSAVLSVSTTTTIGILVGSALTEAVPGGDAARLMAAVATLSLLVGVILLVSAALRFGFVANFISEPVLAGFKAGIGAVIVADQLPKLLGLHVQKVGFFRDLLAIVRAAGGASIPTLLLSVAAVATILALKHWIPRVPAALVAVAAGIAASALLAPWSLGIRTIGTIPAGLPSVVRPDLGLVEALWPAALAIALMSFTETIACGRAFAGPSQARPASNVELLATGAANVVGGLFGAMPSGGGTSQTLVNQRAGARTPIAGLVLGMASLVTLLLLAPALSLMPEAVLAAIVLVYSVELVSVRDFQAIAAIRRTELVWALTAFAGVLLLGTLRGILVAVITSLLALGYQASNPAVYEVARKPGTNVFRRRTDEHPEDETYPGLLMVRVEGRLFFGNTERVLDLLASIVQRADPKVIVLDCSAIFDLEYSALKMMKEADDRVRSRGAELWLAALNPQARRVVERSPLGKALGRERMCFDLEHAVAGWERREAART
ncbi:SulP family inorganic anion transporter [Anaeromyxobacter oryzae]|uniref:Sodium-independent anion transporter n=1 Tax=Anaeromyxobacter oryzae TaxID=2918170 RepID=A0ABM7WPR1_9BACT|nr:SulP family inorganic anion transporter [Anaeromyxobacter oryzae]BDG01454.1 sodium-independent anion transporter [Anaeromyxobacter oryzae]